MDKPYVIVTRRLPDSIHERTRTLFNAELSETDEPMSKEALIKAVQKADVLVPTVTDKIDAGVINAAGNQLKLIANFGAGVDHIDMEAAKAKDIMVTNTPSVLTDDTADITMALILAAPRRVAEAAKIMREDKWSGWSPTFLLGRRVSGKKLGIIGMGRIGQAVAKRAIGFGLDIHYHSRRQLHDSIESELHATYWSTLDDMLKEMDILSINCPYNQETHHLINAKRLAMIKKESYLINTARGAIVDEYALIEALNNKQIAGAGLDVYENEPNIKPEFRGIDNLVMLPHICSSTIESRTQMGEKVLINIQSFMDGHRPPDRVLHT
jgi:glyoxylate reductase